MGKITMDELLSKHQAGTCSVGVGLGFSITEAQADEAHPMVLQAIASRQGIRFYTASLYAILEPVPDGYISLAIDPKAGEAYGVYHLSTGTIELPVAAMWFAARGSIDEAVRFFILLLEAEGIL